MKTNVTHQLHTVFRLMLDPRVYNTLRKLNVKSIADLKQLQSSDFDKLRGCGKATRRQIKWLQENL